MSMGHQEAKAYIIEKTAVTAQKVGIAKRFILAHFDQDTQAIFDAFVQHLKVSAPENLVLDETVDPLPVLNGAAEAFTWELAFNEAVWGLIRANLIMPLREGTGEGRPHLPYSAGAHSAGLRFEELRYAPCPTRVVKAPSQLRTTEQPLCDGDLYLHELNLPGLQETVELALREAVHCFRHELYLACLAMLGRACEGAWIELGLSLAGAAGKAGYAKADKLKENLESSRPGIAAKIAEVVKLYERQDLFKSIGKSSGVKLDDLRNAVIWTDGVRESRNSIHYGAEAPMSNSDEKVAALLIGAIPHLRIVYRLKTAADEES